MEDVLKRKRNQVINIFRGKALWPPTTVVFVVLTVFSLIFSLFTFHFSPALAATPATLNYQGKLTDASNVAVTDGSYIMKFRLYTTATSATTTNIWEEIRTATGDLVPVTNGLFSALVGSSTPLTSVNWNQQLYLGVEVCGTVSLAGCDGEMTPRKALSSVPSAFLADQISGSLLINQSTSTITNLTMVNSTTTNATSTNLAVFRTAYFGGTATSTFNSSGDLLVMGSTTLQNFTARNATTTNATTTNLYVSGLGTLSGGLLVNNATSTITNLTIVNATSTNATSTNLYLSGSLLANSASSTITNLTIVNATTTSATTTNLYISGRLNLDSTTATSTFATGGFTIGTSHFVVESGSGSIGIGTTTLTVSSSTLTDKLTLYNGSFSQKPGNPTLVIATSTAGWDPQAVVVQGRYAYTIGSGVDELRIIDVSNPAYPFIVGSLAIGSFPTDLKVRGRYAYVVDAGSTDLKIIDVSDPATPVQTSTLAVASNPLSIDVQGRYAYVVGTRIQIIDISNPQTPIIVSSKALTSSAFIVVSGRYAYANQEAGGNTLSIMDVSDPADPVWSNFQSSGVKFQNLVLSGRYLYSFNDTNNAIHITDVSNPSLPVVKATFALSSTSDLTTLFVTGRYLYAVNKTRPSLESSTLLILDVSSSTNPIQVGSLLIDSSADTSNDPVFVNGRYAYVVDTRDDDLKIIDLSGIEVTSGIVHSLEAGSLQVRESVAIGQNLSISGGLNIGAGGIFSSGPLSVSVASSTAYGTASTSAYFQGNVGIGTTTPISTLSIQGSLCVRDTGSCGTTAGNIYASNVVVQSTDLAENYPISDETLVAGDIVALSPETKSYASPSGQGRETIGTLVKAQASSTRPVLGIVSTKPGLLFGYDIKEAPVRPVALAGRVPVRVTNEAGPIAIGDEITPSSRPGYGRKAVAGEQTVGIALESFTGQEGSILTFVHLGRSRLASTIGGLNPILTAPSTMLGASTSSPAILENIKAITSASGAWSISESGEFVVNRLVLKDRLCLGSTCVDEHGFQAILNWLSSRGDSSQLTASPPSDLRSDLENPKRSDLAIETVSTSSPASPSGGPQATTTIIDVVVATTTPEVEVVASTTPDQVVPAPEPVATSSPVVEPQPEILPPGAGESAPPPEDPTLGVGIPETPSVSVSEIPPPPPPVESTAPESPPTP